MQMPINHRRFRPETQTRGERRRRKGSRERARRTECLLLPNGKDRKRNRAGQPWGVSNVERPPREAKAVDRRGLPPFWSTSDGL